MLNYPIDKCILERATHLRIACLPHLGHLRYTQKRGSATTPVTAVRPPLNMQTLTAAKGVPTMDTLLRKARPGRQH